MEELMSERAMGQKLNEGKTKIIWEIEGDESFVIIQSKDDITAGDGAKHDVIEGKARLATQTTCNVFRLLSQCGIPLAFQEQINETNFLAAKCEMLLYEVVVRREAHGSYLKRHPFLTKGHVFPRLILEFFLKTKNCEWQEIAIPKDDPLIIFKDGEALLFRPDMPLSGQNPFLSLSEFPGSREPELFKKMGGIAKEVFLILERAWHTQGCRLVDFKVEFGKSPDGELLLADVIDNDSWRVIENGEYIDKQAYRDGAPLNVVTERYQRVCRLTDEFRIPRQRVIIWRASTNDDITPFTKAFEPFAGNNCNIEIVTHSAHKEPIASYIKLAQCVQELPDCVIIAYAGKSNGLGPMLAANTSVPVITVPADIEEFPDDIWSSLRLPSNVPLTTAINPSDAVLAALNMLAMRNPRLYAKLRVKLEERLVNIANLE
jgi:phosphoribosylaminoimidazole carboxylase/phosphoribosylaminoimidazole-succinocarboxamide synthase